MNCEYGEYIGLGPTEVQMAYTLGFVSGLVNVILEDGESLSKNEIINKISIISSYIGKINFGQG